MPRWGSDGTLGWPGDCREGDEPLEHGLHNRFSAIARRQPERVAVRANGTSITYGRLDAESDRLAAVLGRCGTRPGERIGLCCGRGVELITGMLAILKAGGAYVPIDPAFPEARTELLVRDSGVRTVLADRPGCAAIAAHGVRVLDIEDLAHRSTGAVRPWSASGDSIAYVIHTSGSTGTPKGVQVTHDNVLRLFDRTAHWFSFTDTDVWTMFHSPCFDFSVWEIWGALLHGGVLVLVPTDVVGNPARLLTLLAEERVTVLNLTPSAFRLLATARQSTAPAGPDLRLIIFGGERLDVALLGDWMAARGDERPQLVNMYGITETTVHVTYRRIRVGDLARPDRSPIGWPIPDLRVSLHDANGALVPDGTAGDLGVRARGDRRLPEPACAHRGALRRTGRPTGVPLGGPRHRRRRRADPLWTD